MNIFDINKKYLLHDCRINKVYIQNSKLIFNFFDGLYTTDNAENKTHPCRMELCIHNLNVCDAHMHIEITEFRKNKCHEIPFLKFQKMLESSNVVVYLDFYSPFCNGMFLKCNHKNGEIQIQITEIDAIDFKFGMDMN